MKPGLFITLPLLFLSSAGLSAQDISDTLQTASVTAFSSRQAVPVSRLEGKSLERLSSSSVADALKYFSGAQIKDYGGLGGLKTVNVRSLGSQHVGVFLDGVQILNSQNGQVDLGRYSLDNMESVSLYNAHKSETLQGAGEYASGASVYMRSRVPVFSGRPYNLKARVKGGSFGSISPSLRYERRLGRSALSLEGMFLNSRGDYRFRIKNALEDTSSRRSNGDIMAMRAEAGLWASPWGGEFQAHAYFYSSERGLPGPVVRRLSDQYSSKDRQWDRTAFAQASFRKTGKSAAMLLSGKLAWDRLEYLSDPAKNKAAAYAHNIYRQRSAFLSAAAAWYPCEWLSMNFAADGRFSDLRCNVTGFSYVRRLDAKAVAAATVLLGGFSASGSGLFTLVRDWKQNAPDPLTRFTPTLTLAWAEPSGRLTLRAFCKSSFRAPTFNDLYYTLVGWSRLKPEKASQYDFGAEAPLFRPSSPLSVRLSADVFCNRITDKIVAMPAASQFRWTMMNYGRVRGFGVTATATGRYSSGGFNAGLLVTYTYESARDRTSPERITWGGQIPYTPWHSGSAVLDAGKGPWTGSLSFLYTGARYRSADNIASERLSPWMTVDLSLSRRFSLRGDCGLELGLDVNNLLNQRYEVVTRYPMPGTNFMVKAVLTI